MLRIHFVLNLLSFIDFLDVSFVKRFHYKCNVLEILAQTSIIEAAWPSAKP